MDIADKADDRIYNVIADALENARRNIIKRELEPCGSCHYCSSYTHGKQLFCSKDCAEDHAKYISKK